MTKTVLKFIGGVNKDRIGGNCSIIEHTDNQGQTVRAMFDLGAIFTPYETGFIAAYPNLDEYFDRTDPQTGKVYKAAKPVEALFVTHAHEDHIGALVNYVKMGYTLPPIKTSGFTRNFIRLAFKMEGLDVPLIDRVKNGEEVKIGPDMVVEAVDVSHSIVDSLGFYTQTFQDGKPYAAIMNNGDFLSEENMPVGQTFKHDQYLDVFRRKQSPTTILCLDSTSTVPEGLERIGFEKAVENTLEVVRRNPDRSIIISPVISRSVQNIAIDIEVARRLGTKVVLDGKWLQTIKQAMTLSGYEDFDDIVYKGQLKGYIHDKKVPQKYIICTGAFAQGLENYEYNVGVNEVSPIAMASATKMALGLHQYVRMDRNTLVLARQRIIDEINGQSGPKMLQMMAAQGAKVVISPCGREIGGFEQVQMQDSGHINAKAMGDLLTDIRAVAQNVIVVPIHGNPDQCLNTKHIADSAHLQSYLAGNLDALEISPSGVLPAAEKTKPLTWFAFKQIMPNPYAEREVPLEGLREFWEVSEDYTPLRKVGEADNVRRVKPTDSGYYKTHGYEDADLPVFEKMPKRKRTPKSVMRMSRQRKER